MAKLEKYIPWVVGAGVLYFGYTQHWFDNIVSQINDAVGGILGGGSSDGEDTIPTSTPSVKSFCAVGEWNGAAAQPIADSMIATKPDLIVGLGGYDPQESSFIPTYTKITNSKIPSIWARGSDSDDYLKLFNQEGWEFKYDPDDQVVTFYVLNSANPTTLEEMLKDNDSKFRIVIMNMPIYSPTSKYGQDTAAEAKLMPILTKYKVQLVLQSKNHLYFRYSAKGGATTTQGTVFVGVGTGSDKIDGVGSPNGALVAVQKTGYLRCDLSANTIQGKFLTPQGQVLDQFTVFA